MKDMELHNQDFIVSINSNGSLQNIKVSPEETTDGVEYFKCKLGDENITQIRKDKDGNWEQIWGELDDESVNEIGLAITDREN
jgi:hypothetical protein